MKKTLIFCIVFALGLVFAAACDAASMNHSPPTACYKIMPSPIACVVADIVTLSEPLTFISETDSEVVAFYRNTPVDEMEQSEFLRVLNLPPTTPITEQSFDAFFATQEQGDKTGQWAELRSYLQNNLTNRVVFKLPRPAPYGAQYDAYAVGLFGGNRVVGIQVFGVET